VTWIEPLDLPKSQHLNPAAGMPTTGATEPTPDLPDAPDSLQILQALRDQNGNVARAAQQLKMHRTQLRRWLACNAVNPRQFAISDPRDP
jgi:DNA-binding NtrC family response regulator